MESSRFFFFVAHMEPKNGGLVQMIFLFKCGDFYVPAVNFRGCRCYVLVVLFT